MASNSGGIEIDAKQIERFIKKLRDAANSDFKKQLAVWFEAAGIDFLDVVQDEIIRLQVVDTRLLLNSFQKGGKDGIWVSSDGGLTLEVGTNLKYAKWVNDGHYTNPQGQSFRFVPGIWSGDKFIYQPGAKTGMVLRQKKVPGKPYWDNAVKIYEKIFEQAFQRKLEDWLAEVLGGSY